MGEQGPLRFLLAGAVLFLLTVKVFWNPLECPCAETAIARIANSSICGENRAPASVQKRPTDEEQQPRSIPPADPTPVAREDSSSSCRAILDRIQKTNACFRQPYASCDSAAPLYNWGFYQGQGFGRVIEHGLTTCLLASTLNRPCIIDLDPRDPYYTWRSFINVGTYDWDPRIVSSQKGNITAAMQRYERSPKDQNGEPKWVEPTVDELRQYDVMEMVKSDEWKNNEEFYSFWGATNELTRNKIVLSTNWGRGWFPRVKTLQPVITRACPEHRLRTLLQNAMFAPTSLARTLHEERRDAVVNATTFGAIHLRMYLLDKGQTRTNGQRAEIIKGCIETYSHIQKWWLIGDDPEVATYMSTNLDNVYSAYSDEFNSHNVHSNAEKARGAFGHEAMAPSVEDWMVLHESALTLITDGAQGHHTAYGETGGRGNGKINLGKCGGIFVVYGPPPDEDKK